jgi:hypothetical protein
MAAGRIIQEPRGEGGRRQRGSALAESGAGASANSISEADEIAGRRATLRSLISDRNPTQIYRKPLSRVLAEVGALQLRLEVD